MKLTKAVVFCLIVTLVAYLWNLGSVGLIDETEPLFAEAARQMVVTGDWLTPYFNEATRFDKPPLVYWAMAIGYHWFGVNEWAVRLPSALAAIALTFACFYTVARFYPPGKFLAPVIITFNMQTLIWARTGVSDMLLSGCMGLALFSFFWGYTHKQSKQWWDFPSPPYLGFYLFLALAVLAKGPVGLLLPVLIIGAFLIYVGQLKSVLQEMGLLWGLGIFLIVSLPWYILIILRHGIDYINTFFGYHNLERFTSVVSNHAGPWYFYFLILFGLFVPWSVYLPVAIAQVQFWRRRYWWQQARSQQLSLFAFFWLITIFLFFTIAVTKLPSYILPLIPAATILVVYLWGEPQPSRGLFWSKVVNIGLLGVLAIAFLLLPQFIGVDAAIANLPEQLAASGLTWRAALIWGFTAFTCVLLFSTGQKFIWTNVVAFVLFFTIVLMPALFWLDEVRQLPLRELASLIVEIKQPQEEIFILGRRKPTIVFYSHQPVQLFNVEHRLTDYINATQANYPPNATVLILSEPRRLERFEIRDYQLLASKGVYQLVRVSREKLGED